MAANGNGNGQLSRLRSLAAAVFIVLSAVLVGAIVIGRPVTDSQLGIVIGAMGALLGVGALGSYIGRTRKDD